MIDNKISIKGDAVVDIQRGAIGHRATWTGLTYTHACKAGSAQEMEEIIRAAIAETGLIQGAEIKAAVSGSGECDSFCGYVFLPECS